MSDYVIVRCVHCPFEAGKVPFIPGEQKIRCPECFRTTIVKIGKDGTLNTY